MPYNGYNYNALQWVQLQFFTMYIDKCLDRIGVGEIYNVKGGRVKNVEIFEKWL